MAKIVIGLTGSVSVYKSINVLRILEKRGHSVRAILTESAQKFLSRLLVKSTISGDVYTDEDFWKTGKSVHIELARWADLIAIVPCTANTISKIRYGLADNLLTSTVLAFKGPLLIAPAMHQEMWLNLEIQGSVEYLKEFRGTFVSGPEKGVLASGEIGCGRLLKEEFIVEDIEAVLKGSPLKDYKVLLCYGRTEEPIDAVRVITNRSSGLMGFYIAKAVKEHGGNLIQVVGETSIPPYGRDETIRVRTAEEMLEAVRKYVEKADVLIMAAAVSDYRSGSQYTKKSKKGDRLTVTLLPTKDILKTVAPLKRENQIFVGFALETDNLEDYAKKKLEEKNLDIIIGNYASAMGSEFSSGLIMDKSGGLEEFSNVTKETLAVKIVEKIIKMLK
ncbi:MAG: bifunctional phosphopantothenoylcysteine decarboxylase/phosphopantothenate--cysteine ligase CoaBC [bacterium]|nr:bifunctional phosphopantothenoylcysteine decarboxylase/phosphopantothenate--cysteine ligase CoaBC [bacterium]